MSHEYELSFLVILDGSGATDIECVGSTAHCLRATTSDAVCASLKRRNTESSNASVEMSVPGSWSCRGALCAECKTRQVGNICRFLAMSVWVLFKANSGPCCVHRKHLDQLHLECLRPRLWVVNETTIIILKSPWYVSDHWPLNGLDLGQSAGLTWATAMRQLREPRDDRESSNIASRFLFAFIKKDQSHA